MSSLNDQVFYDGLTFFLEMIGFMNNMNNKLNVGDTFKMGHVECKITQIDRFGLTPHYGFSFWTEEGEFHGGWMPVLFVDTMMTHYKYIGDPMDE